MSDETLKTIALQLNNIETNVDKLLIELKDIKIELAGVNRCVVKAETKIEHNEKEIKALKLEDKSIWDHFPLSKEELKKDLKEYTVIISKQESQRIKLWVYGSFIAACSTLMGLIIMIIKILV